MNFGQRVSLIGDEPFAPIKNGYQLIQKIPIEKRFCSDGSQKSREELEAILLVGLPGIGKTSWAEKYTKCNPEKQFSIVGLSSILEKMKDVDKIPEPVKEDSAKPDNVNKDAKSDENSLAAIAPTKPSSSSQVIVPKSQMELLDKALKCMNVLLDIAAQSNRNIIIDQPNVYQSTRTRKMKLFEKYKRRAVVLMSSCSEYQELLAKNENVNESYMILVNDMKANFTLPKVGTVFQSVEYVNMDEEKAEKLVLAYNTEGAENRLNNIIEKRNQKRLTSKQSAARVLSHSTGAGNKFGASSYPYQVPYSGQMPMYGNEPRNRFGLNPINNHNRFINNNYYNQAVRMDVNSQFPPTVINPMMNQNYMRPPMFINHGGIQPAFPPNIGMPPNFNLVAHHQQQQRHAVSYGLNQSWPAATSTEIWNQNNQRMPTASSSNWAPALPVSQASQHQGGMLNRMPASQWPTNGNNGNGKMPNPWPSANQPN